MKEKNAKIYAFSSIMRISNNNINQEEKEYWSDWGKKIFEYSYNFHKNGRVETDVPQEILKDYLETRKRNFEINKIYNGNIGHGIFQKQLMKINQNQIITSKNNKQFLNKTLKEILSAEPSKRVNNCKEKDHNEILIKQLISEGTQEKKDYFNGFFNLTFLDCLKYFRGDENEKNH